MKQRFMEVHLAIRPTDWWKAAITCHPANNVLNHLAGGPFTHTEYCRHCVIAEALNRWLLEDRPQIFGENFVNTIHVDEVIEGHATFAIMDDDKMVPYFSICLPEYINKIIREFDDRMKLMPQFQRYEGSALTHVPSICKKPITLHFVVPVNSRTLAI